MEGEEEVIPGCKALQSSKVLETGMSRDLEPVHVQGSSVSGPCRWGPSGGWDLGAVGSSEGTAMSQGAWGGKGILDGATPCVKLQSSTCL